MDINWEEFPLTHPNLFSSILIHCDPGDILSCRIVCTTWRAWFNSSSIWSKLLDRLLDDTSLFERSSEHGPLTWYRMRKLLELSREESEEDCLVSCMKIHRALKEPVSIQVSEETMARVAKLERTIPVIGPPALFIRVKVDHAVVRKIIGEMLCRYLTVIILDKEDTVQEHVKLMIMRSMYGTDGAQNWIYVDNLRPKAKVTEEEDEDAPEGLVLEGEHRLEEALRMSMEPSNRGEKRKNSDDSDTEESDSKKAKLDKDKDDNQEESDMDKSQEDEANTSNKVLYIIDDQVPSSSMFPTILDLLSIDNEVVKSVFIEKCNIDKLYVVPQFNKFLKYLPELQASGSKVIVGTDEDGKVVSVDIGSFSGQGDLMVGTIEQPQHVYSHPERLLQMWAARDVRDRWPEFSQHLQDIDTLLSKEQTKPSSSVNFNPMVIKGSEESGKENQSESDIMASLAARGISIQRK